MSAIIGIRIASQLNESITQPLYKYVDVAGLRRILDGSIRFTQPSAFNDPFELLPEIVLPTNEPARPINVSFDILARRRSPPVAELDHIPQNYCSSDATSRDIVRQLSVLIGILSVSRTNQSLLMWSHYADQYTGAVIEFDGSHEFFAGQIDIEYRPTRPKRDLSDYLAGEPIPVSELCVKSDQAAHEQEVRVIRTLADCEKIDQYDQRGFQIYIRRIPLECIKGIFLGERTDVSVQREIYSRVKDTNISLTLAAVDASGYAFRHERIKFNVPASRMGPMMSPRTAHIFSNEQNVRAELARWMIDHHPLSKVVNKPI
jgi:hypothetical protein